MATEKTIKVGQGNYKPNASSDWTQPKQSIARNKQSKMTDDQYAKDRYKGANFVK